MAKAYTAEEIEQRKAFAEQETLRTGWDVAEARWVQTLDERDARIRELEQSVREHSDTAGELKDRTLDLEAQLRETERGLDLTGDDMVKDGDRIRRLETALTAASEARAKAETERDCALGTIATLEANEAIKLALLRERDEEIAERKRIALERDEIVRKQAAEIATLRADLDLTRGALAEERRLSPNV